MEQPVEPKQEKHRRYAAVFRRWLLTRLSPRFGVNRTPEYIRTQYGLRWKAGAEDFGRAMSREVMWELDGRPVRWRFLDVRKFFIGHLNRALGASGPVSSVLELGSGDGFNLLALSVLHPAIRVWRGIELTAEGVGVAERFRADPPLEALSFVTGFDVPTIRKRLEAADIRCDRGDMLALPFSGRSFDAVFSCLAIEQLPRDYPAAFREAARVAARSAFFIEEFREAQRNLFDRMHLRNVDYFSRPYREVERAGLSVSSFEELPARNPHFGFGLLICTPS